MEKIIIFGTGQFAELVHYYLCHDDRYEVVAYTETAPTKRGFRHLKVIPFKCIQDVFPPDQHKMFVAVGYNQRNDLRTYFYNEAKNKGYELITWVHPDTILPPNVYIGDNCFIFERNNIQPFVSIGNNVIMWSGNHIGHHSIIHDNVFVASHVVVSGNCEVGKNCFLGVNSTLIDDIILLEYVYLGAGTVATKTITVKGIYVGAPARRINEWSGKRKD